MNNNKKSTLITGGCGFVGRHLIKKLLDRGDSLWVIDNLFTGKHPDEWLGADWQKEQNNEYCKYTKGEQLLIFVQMDVLVFFTELVNKNSKIEVPDFKDLYHLASIVGGRVLIDGDPLLVSYDLAIDSLMFLWVTRYPKKVERVLYASSSAAYPTNLQSKEKTVALLESYINFNGELGQPDMTYGWSKLSGEYLAGLAHKKYGIHIACVRPFSGYGEDQDLTYPVPSIALRVARGDNPIEVWGTGEQGRDFVHIDDCIDAMLVILDKVKDGRGVNIGSGKLISFNELIKIMCEISNHDAEIKHLLDKPVGVQSRYADTTYLNNEIGWIPKITLKEGMRNVLDYAKNHRL